MIIMIANVLLLLVRLSGCIMGCLLPSVKQLCNKFQSKSYHTIDIIWQMAENKNVLYIRHLIKTDIFTLGLSIHFGNSSLLPVLHVQCGQGAKFGNSGLNDAYNTQTHYHILSYLVDADTSRWCPYQTTDSILLTIEQLHMQFLHDLHYESRTVCYLEPSQFRCLFKTFFGVDATAQCSVTLVNCALEMSLLTLLT